MVENHTDELIDDKYYSIRELTIITGAPKMYWYNYTSNKYCYFLSPPLKVKRRGRIIYLRGSEAKRVLSRKRKSIYSMDFIRNSIKIPSFAKGNVIEMCIKVAILAEEMEIKRIWAATALYAYYAILNDAYEKEESRLTNAR